jgi:hypothetical protein
MNSMRLVYSLWLLAKSLVGNGVVPFSAARCREDLNRIIRYFPSVVYDEVFVVAWDQRVYGCE